MRVLTWMLQGTWQFMSVALLTHKKFIEICDELEAFFYVIVYYATRYLKSNYSDADVAKFIEAFFDTYNFVDGAWRCGTLKSNATETQFLGLERRKPIVFHSPGLNEVLDTLLSWFHSQYVVNTYEFEMAHLDQPTPPSTTSMPARPTSKLAPQSSRNIPKHGPNVNRTKGLPRPTVMRRKLPQVPTKAPILPSAAAKP